MDWTSIIDHRLREQLEKNWTEQLRVKGTAQELDPQPVVKLFLPWAAATWLLTELEPGTSIAFGLCDLGFGEPELGSICLEEVYDVKGPGGMTVEADIHFKAHKPLSAYAAEARRERRIRA